MRGKKIGIIIIFLKGFYLWNACIYMKIRIEVSGSAHGGNEAVCYIYICL